MNSLYHSVVTKGTGGGCLMKKDSKIIDVKIVITGRGNTKKASLRNRKTGEKVGAFDNTSRNNLLISEMGIGGTGKRESKGKWRINRKDILKYLLNLDEKQNLGNDTE